MSRILIAEDDPHILRLINMWMTRLKHDVREARNGQLAIDALRAEPVDVLVTDLQMPQVDGLQLIEFAAAERRVRCGIILLTNRWDHASFADKLSGWGVRVMPKPFSPSRLAELVDDVLSGEAEPVADDDAARVPREVSDA